MDTVLIVNEDKTYHNEPKLETEGKHHEALTHNHSSIKKSFLVLNSSHHFFSQLNVKNVNL